jgi:AraC-like DNA-binding protein
MQEETFMSTKFGKGTLLCAILSICLFFGAIAQVTIIVNKVPANTPAKDSLFITGQFNDWNPGDKKFLFKKREDGKFVFTIPKELQYFEYKITRGSWGSVEGDTHGKKANNRIFQAAKYGSKTVEVDVFSWEDVANADSWNVYVKKIPASTPVQSPIYLYGNFNNWKVGDPDYKLSALDDKTLAVKISKSNLDTLIYKFNRGSLTMTECRENGRLQSNRVSIWDKGQKVNDVFCEVVAWEDLDGVNLPYSFILSAASLQAIFLIIVLLGFKNRHYQNTQAVTLLLLLTAITLITKLAIYNRAVFNWQPKLLLIADIVYVLYPPLFYLFIHRIVGLHFKVRKMRWVFLVSTVLFLVAYLPLIWMPRNEFMQSIMDQEFNSMFLWVSLLATAYNIFIWVACSRILVLEKQTAAKTGTYIPGFSYASSAMVHAGLCLVIWIISHGIYLFGLLFSFKTQIVYDTTIDLLWLVFAMSTFFHGFMIFRKPELFKNPVEEAEKQKNQNHPKENLQVLKTALEALMKKQKLYLNSKLALQDLADAMHTNVHTLSWVINEGYNKNFFDFINEYRIEEFKAMVAKDVNKKYTFLALAMEVGFSSKTTFNRAFKKCAGKTPREYFSYVQESQWADLQE